MALFLDTNVAIYATGTPHPLREPCRAILRHASTNGEAYVTSVEVLQELMHRYRAIRRWQAGEAVFRDFLELMDSRIEPVYAEDAREAVQLAHRYTSAETRDLFHVAVMLRLGLTEIISTDHGFDAINEVTRIDPAAWTPSQ